jgi:inosose dehydratase
VKDTDMIRVANAPCSWGVLEFESKSASPGYAQVLDEMAASGYAGTELGDWGFMPTDPARLRDELGRRHLTMLGAFVTTRLADPGSYAASTATAVTTARLLAAVASDTVPFIVLSDEPTANPDRARSAGRVPAAPALTARQWDEAARGVEQIARAVRDETGLRTVFHHHCAAYVETPAEIDALLERTDAALVGLCLDSGHATYGAGKAAYLRASSSLCEGATPQSQSQSQFQRTTEGKLNANDSELGTATGDKVASSVYK